MSACLVSTDILEGLCALRSESDLVILPGDMLKKMREWTAHCEEGEWQWTRRLLEAMIRHPRTEQPALYEAWNRYLASEDHSPRIIEAILRFEEERELPLAISSSSSSIKRGDSESSLTRRIQLWMGASLFGVRLPPMVAAAGGMVSSLYLWIHQVARSNKNEIALINEILPMLVSVNMISPYLNVLRHSFRFLSFMSSANPTEVGVKLLRYGAKRSTTTSSIPTARSKKKEKEDMATYDMFFQPAALTTTKSATKKSPEDAETPVKPPSELVSKNATIMTRSARSHEHEIMRNMESMIKNHWYIVQHPEILPAALGVLYGVRKSIVIDKYEVLVRSVNNYLRRFLGEKIKPTRKTPAELILSGEVRPIIRRDLLVSNSMLLLALFGPQIHKIIRDLIAKN